MSAVDDGCATMDLRLLEIFCRVYEENGVSRAAQRLGLSQPTVSGHLKSLEQQLGAPLFDRVGRDIVPTAAGRMLYGYARRIGELKGAAVQAVDRLLNRLEGELVVGASTIPGEYLLPRRLGRFCDGFPGIDVRLEIGDTREIVERVEAGKVDLGVVGARLPRPRLEYRKLASDELIPVAPMTPTWPEQVSLEELRQRPWLLREEGSGTRLVFERRLRELGLGLADLHVVARLGSTTAVKEAVKAGLGASMLSAISVAAEIDAGWLKRLDVPEIGPLARDVLVVTDRERTSSPLAEAFVEHLEDTVRG